MLLQIINEKYYENKVIMEVHFKVDNILKKCFKCDKEMYIPESVNICPICKEVLHNQEKNSKTKSNDINIIIDFTYFKCDCGNSSIYGEKICKQCGQEIANTDIDPKVKLRKERFEDIINFINTSDKYIKDLRRQLNKDYSKKVILEDFISFVIPKMNEVEKLTKRKIFKDISFSEEVIGNEEMTNKISEIKAYMEQIYDIYIELLIVEVPYAWENSYRRICSSIKNFLDSNRLIIFSIVSDTLKDAFNNINLAQEKLDLASDDIELFSNILNIKNLEINFDMFEDGNINVPIIMLMMLGGNIQYNQIGDALNILQFNTYKYFKSFLPMEFEYYTSLKQPILVKIASYKLMGMTSFLENNFFEKIKIVINVLERAKDINFNELKKFINEFKYKYLYALETTNNVVQDCILTLSYSKNEKMIVRNAMRWYKDLSEGVYRDISSLLISCSYIIDKKEIDYEHVFEWMGFPDKLDFIEKKKKLNLHKLTDGVEKTLRHSEAHVNFEIDDVNNIILVRNNISKEKIIKEITFSYEEFFKLQSKLQETIFSIIAGLDLFIANNYTDFEEFFKEVDKEISITYEASKYQCVLLFFGIINIKEIYDNDNNYLIITGTSIDKKDRELLENCTSCVAQIVTERPEIDKIIVKLNDDINREIGLMEIDTKYIKRYFEAEDKYKKYESLLMLMTRKINYIYDNEYIQENDILGTKFASAILQWSIDLIKGINDLNTSELSYIENLRVIKSELIYSINTINEFESFINDKRLLEYIKNIMIEFIDVIDKIIDGRMKNSLKSSIEASITYKKICCKITEVFGVLSESEKIISLLSINNNTTSLKVGRNDLCPCGSGKKYKKCCLKKDLYKE
jgi:Predicted metal-binding protein related to the C-terminal domain of SecA